MEAVIADAKDRQVFNPIEKTLDMAKKRVTDLEENSKVSLPQPIDAKFESEMVVVRNTILKEFDNYKREMEEKLIKI